MTFPDRNALRDLKPVVTVRVDYSLVPALRVRVLRPLWRGWEFVRNQRQYLTRPAAAIGFGNISVGMRVVA